MGASEQGVGALHIAANLGHIQITKILVENGGKVNELDKDGDTPLIAGMWVVAFVFFFFFDPLNLGSFSPRPV